MKKELFLAILIGLVLGLVIVFGIYRTKIFFTPKNEVSQPTPTTTTTPADEVISNLLIHSPLDETIVETEEVTIAGTTNPNYFIAIIVNDQNFITNADESGNFSLSVKLETGSNVMQINSIDEDGEIITKELTVIYSTKPLTATTETTTQEQPWKPPIFF